MVACASGEVDFDPKAASAGAGARGGAGGQGGSSSLCAVDCSAIATPACLKSVCNDGTYQGVVGECVVVPDEGASCDDGQFCTIDDTCDATGQCIGGPPNDCGMTPGQCQEIQCDEASDSCGEAGSMNGAPCQDPSNLCLKGSTCNNGACTGGTLDDCFFFPLPDDCHVAECDPTDGMCMALVGNEGLPCIDPADLCTVGKTCTTGVCTGGAPKDCSSLTVGCFNGVCNTNTGQCFQQAVMPGQQCAQGTNQCNVGICDTMGSCNSQPANQGMPCSDSNACTGNDLCNNGSCVGTAVTQCMNGDSCCPPTCTINNDNDCTTSCLGILQSNPNAPDGPYQILENNMMVNVYCDMTHGGVTYRALAFGNHSASYSGYTLMSVADLLDPVIQQAFIYLYNQQGNALNNLNTNYNSSNCCIKLAEHVNQQAYLTLGGSYVYPASLSNFFECNSGYFNMQYRFYLATSNLYPPAPLPSNYFQQFAAGTTNLCSNADNPGWFWKKF